MQVIPLCRSLRHYCSNKLASTSNQPELPKEKTKLPDKGVKTTLARFLPKGILDSIDEHRPKSAATTLGFPNKRGLDDYDPDIPLETLRRNAPPLVKSETYKLAGEISQMLKPKFDKPDIYKCVRGLHQDEIFMQYNFKSEEGMEKWQTGCDSDWGEGYSKCELFRTDKGTAIFQGTLSTKLIKDGKTERAGWCGMKTIDRHAYNRRVLYKEWEHFSHLIIKCRGDGRRYKVMLHSPGVQDVTWFDSHTYPLHTHGGPYWQYEKIPFSRFFHTVRDRIQDDQYAVPKHQVSAVGITLNDRINGDFKLEIDFIGACHDTSHTEKFAYEMFQLPVLATKGF